MNKSARVKSYWTGLFLIGCLMPFRSLAVDTRYPRFNELKKVSVGPDDQFAATAHLTQPMILFTHRANMISQLQAQDLSTGKVKNVFAFQADSSQGQFNSKGQLVFVYYKNNSRGDICFTDEVNSFESLPLSENQIHCFPRSINQQRFERSQPFWLADSEIGFLERNLETNSTNSQVVISSTSLMTQQTILYSAPGLISVSGSLRGEGFVVSEIIQHRSVLTYINRWSHKQNHIIIELPGTLGFTTLSPRGDFIYFTHFMGDSNHDTLIDGHDNAVVWRVSLANTKSLEQITPMDYSCSFPHAINSILYLTCAFEGSLDIYQLPEEGMVPTHWDIPTINKAFEVARSYQDRILLLNTLKSRAREAELLKECDSRLLYLHILADEPRAALYYLEKVSAPQSLKIYLQARILKKSQSIESKTFQWKQDLEKLQKDLKSLKGEDSLKIWVHHFLLILQGKKPKVETLKTYLGPSSSSLELWLWYQLASEIYSKTEQNISPWLSIYETLISSPSFNFENQIYFAYDLLQILETANMEKRIRTLVDFISKTKSSPEVRALLQAELSSLSLVNSVEKNEKTLALKKLDALMVQFKSHYFLRKAINVRSILIFLQHQQFKESSQVAANWIRDTPQNSPEFMYAREVVISAARELGYGFWAQKNPRLAADYFFQSLSLTDDLESYVGYMMTMSEIGQQKNRNERLEYLEKRQVMKDGVLLVKALLELEEARIVHTSEKSLEMAIENIEKIRSDLVDPLRNLIVGYAYLELFYKTKKGLDYDQKLWQKAHQALVVAADLSRGRRRVYAAALTNLALLHLWIQDYDQSVRYWSQRKQLGFDEPSMSQEKQALTWFYSKALFLSQQPKMAAQEIEELAPNLQTPEFLEQKAFYLAMDQNFQESIKVYDQLLQDKRFLGKDIGSSHRRKINFIRAYNYFKTQQYEKAQSLFRELLLNQKEGSVFSKVDSKDSSFIANTIVLPEDFESLILGFQSQMGSEEEKLKALKQRHNLIKDDLGLSILIQMRMAELISKMELTKEKSSIPPMTQASSSSDFMKKTILECLDYADQNGELSQIVFRCLTNYLVHALVFIPESKKESHKPLKTLFQKVQTSLMRQEELLALPVLREHWRLEYLWGLFHQFIEPNSYDQSWKLKLDKSSLSMRLKQSDEKGFISLQKDLASIESAIMPH